VLRSALSDPYDGDYQCSTLLGHSVPPTPLWDQYVTEQSISITIDNSSVFVPGAGPPQYGFRRTEFIAQANGSNAALDAVMEVGTTVFHFSIQKDGKRPLNYSHEYQIVFIEPDDGTHVFEIQLGMYCSVTVGCDSSLMRCNRITLY
jgi:hypothetical protein